VKRFRSTARVVLQDIIPQTIVNTYVYLLEFGAACTMIV